MNLQCRTKSLVHRPRRLRLLLSVAVFCFFTCNLIRPTACAADGLEKVRVRLVNGSSIRATINSIDADGVISGSGIVNGMSLEEIVTIDTGRDIAQSKTSAYVLLQMGGKLLLDRVSSGNEKVAVFSQNQEREYPLEVVQAIVWSQSTKVMETLAAPSREFDSIVVATSRGETVVPGLLDAINDTHVLIDYKGEQKKISLSKVKAVVMARLSDQKPTGTKCSVVLSDGSRINGMINGLAGSALTISFGEQHSLSVDTAEIASISIESQRVRFLSDLEPLRYEDQVQFAVPRSWQRDRSVLGNPLRLKQNSTGRVLDFAKGLGTRSFSSLVFQNDNNFTHLRAIVGIDMETEGHGDCELVIEGDGIKLWSKRVTGRDDPEPVVVEIKDIDEIALIVRPGENFDLADHADWAEARFTKSK